LPPAGEIRHIGAIPSYAPVPSGTGRVIPPVQKPTPKTRFGALSGAAPGAFLFSGVFLFSASAACSIGRRFGAWRFAGAGAADARAAAFTSGGFTLPVVAPADSGVLSGVAPSCLSPAVGAL
jgi:hypothetical protein